MAHPSFDLSGKVALVTGGNSGIGLGMAEAMAEAGADVCIWGTNEAKNAAALERLQAHGTKVRAMICDVSDEARVEAGFTEVVADFGRVDGCFANAGIGGSTGAAPLHEMTTENWKRMMAVNLDGIFYTYRAACRHMIERGGGGRLVATSSTSAISGAPRTVHYATTKGAMLSLTYALAVGMARYGVTANVILPGWIETPMTERTFAWDKFAANVLPRVPMRRWGEGQDFGGIAVYLLSDASAYHTGDSFVIDGGYTKF
jgi:NAD(P)-dependent dehydrogenase (short-subunit alcohol dehydrogenase family)